MNKSNAKRIIALAVAVQSVISMAGCGDAGEVRTSKLPTVGYSSSKDVRDYYKAQMNYDNVITRTSTVNYTKYEKHAVQEETANKILGIQQAVEKLLSSNTYDASSEGAKYMTEDAWAYFKSDLEDKELYDGVVGDVTEADGFYFVDVTYKMRATNAIGQFTNYAPLVGINGAFIRDADGNDHVEPYYLASICTALNNYYIANEDPTRLSYDGTTFTVQTDGTTSGVMSVPDEYYDDFVNGPDDTADDTADGANAGATDETVDAEAATDADAAADDTDEAVTDGEDAAESTEDTAAESEETVIHEDWDGLITDNSVSNMDGRENPIDISVINDLVGTSTRSRAYLPRLDLVYTPAESSAISGWAIYPQGTHDLTSYNASRDAVSGEVVVRYVFKQNLNNPEQIDGYNFYIVNVTNPGGGIENIGTTPVVPDFVTENLSKTIERWDRCVVNNDLPGMQSGGLLTDMGMGIDYAYKYSNGNILRRQSTLRKVLGHNTEDNTYLLDVETFTEEGSKFADTTGTYISRYYVTVKLVGQNFYITDYSLQSRELQRDFDITPDKSVQRRLTALNLSGEVADTTKQTIRDFMADYYLATNRLAGNDYEYTNNGVSVQKRGLYDIVENDQTMLDADDRRDLLETLVNYMQKNNGAQAYSGAITEWVGGNDTQVELQTEEIWVWNTGTAEYQTVYYLLSNMENKWVIDQRTVLSSQSIDTGYDGYLSRIQADAPVVQMESTVDTVVDLDAEQSSEDQTAEDGSAESTAE